MSILKFPYGESFPDIEDLQHDPSWFDVLYNVFKERLEERTTPIIWRSATEVKEEVKNKKEIEKSKLFSNLNEDEKEEKFNQLFNRNVASNLPGISKGGLLTTYKRGFSEGNNQWVVAPQMHPKQREKHKKVLREIFEEQGIQICSRAPGSTFLFSEHAVVHGQPAIMIPIPLYTFTGVKKIEKKDKYDSQIDIIDVDGDGDRFTGLIKPKKDIEKIKPKLTPPLKAVKVINQDVMREVDKIVKKHFDEVFGEGVYEPFAQMVVSSIPSSTGLGGSAACGITLSLSLHRLFEKKNGDKCLTIKELNEFERYLCSWSDDCWIYQDEGLIEGLKNNKDLEKVFHSIKNLAIRLENIYHSSLSSGAQIIASMVGNPNGFPLFYAPMFHPPKKDDDHFCIDGDELCGSVCKVCGEQEEYNNDQNNFKYSCPIYCQNFQSLVEHRYLNDLDKLRITIKNLEKFFFKENSYLMLFSGERKSTNKIQKERKEYLSNKSETWYKNIHSILSPLEKDEYIADNISNPMGRFLKVPGRKDEIAQIYIESKVMKVIGGNALMLSAILLSSNEDLDEKRSIMIDYINNLHSFYRLIKVSKYGVNRVCSYAVREQTGSKLLGAGGDVMIFGMTSTIRKIMKTDPTGTIRATPYELPVHYTSESGFGLVSKEPRTPPVTIVMDDDENLTCPPRSEYKGVVSKK